MPDIDKEALLKLYRRYGRGDTFVWTPDMPFSRKTLKILTENKILSRGDGDRGFRFTNFAEVFFGGSEHQTTRRGTRPVRTGRKRR